jgi:protein gp37
MASCGSDGKKMSKNTDYGENAMGENSEISWTNHTFNAWEGCEKVSAGCANCYAERRDKLYHGGEHWGPEGTRKMMSESYWRQPVKWNKQAEAEGVRARVFCSSLADVFEDRPELEAPRLRLLALIEETSNLDWLLLTKRPENVTRLIERAQKQGGAESSAYPWLLMQSNVWIGTTVENQEQADKRIPELLKIPARIRFLSCDPLLGPVEFSDVSRRADAVQQLGKRALDGIQWVIAGGESGPNARPMHPDWARSLRDQCTAAGVAFHFKQHGEWVDPDSAASDKIKEWMGPSDGYDKHHFYNSKDRSFKVYRVGKKAAGRLLDGRTWDELPEVKA